MKYAFSPCSLLSFGFGATLQIIVLKNRPLSKFALPEKIDDFCVDSELNFETMCLHMAEKFDSEDSKKRNFIGQMGFRKRSNDALN